MYCTRVHGPSPPAVRYCAKNSYAVRLLQKPVSFHADSPTKARAPVGEVRTGTEIHGKAIDVKGTFASFWGTSLNEGTFCVLYCASSCIPTYGLQDCNHPFAAKDGFQARAVMESETLACWRQCSLSPAGRCNM